MPMIIESEKNVSPALTNHLLPNEMDAKQRYDDFLTKFELRDGPKTGTPRGNPRNKLSNFRL